MWCPTKYTRQIFFFMCESVVGLTFHGTELEFISLVTRYVVLFCDHFEMLKNILGAIA